MRSFVLAAVTAIVCAGFAQAQVTEEDLAKDVLEIITVFSARLYGSRSRKNQKLIDTVKKAAEDAQG